MRKQKNRRGDRAHRHRANQTVCAGCRKDESNCAHPHTATIWRRSDRGVMSVAYEKRCATCDVTLSLGPSNDAGSVAMEIRAAELAAPKSAGRVRHLKNWRDSAGWSAHSRGETPMYPDEEAGWLARQIRHHAEERVIEAIARTGERDPVTEQTRHDVAASVARHADLEGGAL